MPSVNDCEAEMDTIQDVTTSGGWGAGTLSNLLMDQFKGFSGSRCFSTTHENSTGAILLLKPQLHGQERGKAIREVSM